MDILLSLLQVTVNTDNGGINVGIIIGPLIAGILIYILTAWLLYRIGKKLNYEKSWYAWIPILNLYMMTGLSTKDTMNWFLLIFVLSLIPCINIIAVIMLIIVWMDIAEACGRERWYGILFIIPIANWVMMYILGSGEAAPPQQGGQPSDVPPPSQ